MAKNWYGSHRLAGLPLGDSFLDPNTWGGGIFSKGVEVRVSLSRSLNGKIVETLTFKGVYINFLMGLGHLIRPIWVLIN